MSIFDDIANTVVHAAEQVAHEVTGVVENASVEQIVETVIETTDGETLAAIEAIESGARSIVALDETKLVCVCKLVVARPINEPIIPAMIAITMAIAVMPRCGFCGCN